MREGGAGKCQGPGGKEIYPTKEAARAALTTFRAKYGAGKGTAYRCPFGDHYHVTKGARRKGR